MRKTTAYTHYKYDIELLYKALTTDGLILNSNNKLDNDAIRYLIKRYGKTQKVDKKEADWSKVGLGKVHVSPGHNGEDHLRGTIGGKSKSRRSKISRKNKKIGKSRRRNKRSTNKLKSRFRRTRKSRK